MGTKALLIVGVVVIVIASLVCYIIARVKLNRGELFLVANGWDVAMVLVAATCGCALCVWLNSMPKNEIILFSSIGGVAFLGSAAMSVVHNWGGFGKIVISVLAKVFVVFLSMLSIPVIAVTSFVISIIALISKDFDLFRILNFKWLFMLIMGPRKSKIITTFAS